MGYPPPFIPCAVCQREQGELPARGVAGAQPLRLSGDAFRGRGGVHRVQLDSQEAAAGADARHARRAGATERVQHQLAGAGEEAHQLHHQRQRLLRLVDARLAGEVSVHGVLVEAVAPTAPPVAAPAPAPGGGDALEAQARATPVQCRLAVRLPPHLPAPPARACPAHRCPPGAYSLHLAERQRPARAEPLPLQRQGEPVPGVDRRETEGSALRTPVNLRGGTVKFPPTPGVRLRLEGRVRQHVPHRPVRQERRQLPAVAAEDGPARARQRGGQCSGGTLGEQVHPSSSGSCT